MSQADRDKWNSKYADPQFAPREPSAVLVGLERHLPKCGRAIDVAGGGGRHGIWLAKRGLDVTIADVSAVGLQQARQRAQEAGVRVAILEADLEAQPFPSGPWDLVVSICYLCRHQFPAFPRVLSPGGVLVVIQPTKRNLERWDKPPPGFLLEDGELPKLVRELEILHYDEGWLADDRHDAVLVARRSD